MALVVVAVAGCEESPQAQTTPAATASAPDVDAGVGVSVLVEGNGVTRGVALSGDAKLDLVNALPDDLADRERWVYLHARAADGRTLTIRDWNARYRGFKAVLYLDEGRATLGIFKIAEPGMAPSALQYGDVPRTKFGGVTVVDVRSSLPPPSPSASAREHTKRPVTLLIDGEPGTLDELDEMPKATLEGREGWYLADMLPHVGVSAPLTRAVFKTRSEVLAFTAAELTEAKPFLRRSGRGELVLMLSAGPDRMHKGVTAIELETTQN